MGENSCPGTHRRDQYVGTSIETKTVDLLGKSFLYFYNHQPLIAPDVTNIRFPHTYPVFVMYDLSVSKFDICG